MNHDTKQEAPVTSTAPDKSPFRPNPLNASPFARAATRPSLSNRFLGRPGMLVFVAALLVGGVCVVWRAKSRRDVTFAHARSEAAGCAAKLGKELGDAVSAAETLGALARQSGGGISGFQNLASGLLASRPSVAALELQPGGIVSDIAPRAGQERAIGVNVLNDATRRVGAQSAIKRRALTVDCPVPLYRGDRGLVAWVPIFTRTRLGGETFWGFVSASARLSEVFRQAQLDALTELGYDYRFYVPAVSGRQAIAIAGSGNNSFADAVTVPVRVGDLELRLALKPHRGWVNITKIVIEGIGVLCAASLLGLVTMLFGKLSRADAALTDANQRLLRETAERTQAKDAIRTANDAAAALRDELKRAQSSLSQADTTIAGLRAKVDAAERDAREIAEGAEARIKETEAASADVLKRLDAALAAADESLKLRNKEQKQARETIAELESRLATTVQENRDAVETTKAKLEQAETRAAKLQIRLERVQRDLDESNREHEEAIAALENQPAQQPAASEQESSASEQAAAGTEEAPVGVEPVAVAAPPTEPEPTTQPEPESRPDVEPPSDEVTPNPEPAPVDAAVEQPPAEPPPPAKPAKRGKARRNNQMDLFSAPEPAHGGAEGHSQTEPSRRSLANDYLSAIKGPVMLEVHRTSRDDSEFAPIEPDADAAIEPDQEPEEEPSQEALEERPAATARRQSPTPRVNPAELRKAVNLILPLFAEQDPGAKDCLKANRATFRSAFSPEGFEEFEQHAKSGEFGQALELLKKAARKHGIL